MWLHIKHHIICATTHNIQIIYTIVEGQLTRALGQHCKEVLNLKLPHLNSIILALQRQLFVLELLKYET